MAKSNSLTFEVKCPCCEATLHIDPELQIVLHHQAVEKKPPIEDLQAAVQNLKERPRGATTFLRRVLPRT